MASQDIDPVTGRRGGWMQTRSGKAWHFADPRVEDVSLFDIAHALSNLCRFGGHTAHFYSVAEHSVYVSMVVPPQFALQGLMHDATEAYVVDVPRPLKHMLGSAYAELEDNAWRVVAEKFSLPYELDPSVKAADNSVLLAERDALLQTPPIEWLWARDVEPAPVKIECLTPRVACEFFLRRFYELGGKA